MFLPMHIILRRKQFAFEYRQYYQRYWDLLLLLPVSNLTEEFLKYLDTHRSGYVRTLFNDILLKIDACNDLEKEIKQESLDINNVIITGYLNT